MRDFVVEYWQFIRARRAYWMIPLIFTLVAFGFLVVFAKSSALAPFVYTFF